MVTISKTFEFSAAHRLFHKDWSEEQNRKVYGKCASSNGHGHNYRLEVGVRGPVDPITGMIMDASVLDAIVTEEVILHVDHKNLDTDVSWLMGRVSTVENLIEAFWQRLEIPVSNAANMVRLHRLVLWETNRIFATREA